MKSGESKPYRLDAHHYPTCRVPLFASRGVVATSEPLAAQAGLSILQRGGNAVDAAIATAVALTVVDPTSSALGSDAFALIWDGTTLHGLNGSGRAPATHTPELFERLGLDHVPTKGWLPVTVPGAPAAWRDAHARFGRLPFAALLESAIAYAERGFPVTPLTAKTWEAAARIFATGVSEPELRSWGDVFARSGRAPGVGELWTLPDHARSLRALAESGGDTIYRGELAARIADFAAATGGYLTRDDLARHESTWVDPIRTTYRGHDVWELPPNSPGLVTLAALGILEHVELARHPRESVESYHLQIEAIKLAIVDAMLCAPGRDLGDADLCHLLTAGYAEARARRIGPDAGMPTPMAPRGAGTAYVCVADGDGLMVSWIQSNYSGWLLGFGSGVVVPGTGIALHNRGCSFSLDRAHPNVVAPHKRPFHTLAPAFLTRDGRAIGPFGMTGGPMQPQGQVQMIVNQIDYGMDPQSSLDAPRWQWSDGADVEVELAVPREVMRGLAARGHVVTPHVEYEIAAPRAGAHGLVGRGDFGKGQIVRRMESGVYVAGSDPRCAGCAIGY